MNRFDKLIQGCGWAKKHGLKVWVDIHSVPGSQNGYDNSGRSGPIHWANNRDYYTRTQYTFNRLATLFSQPEWQGTVTAIEAVNEPAANRNGDVANLINECVATKLRALRGVLTTTTTLQVLPLGARYCCSPAQLDWPDADADGHARWVSGSLLPNRRAETELTGLLSFLGPLHWGGFFTGTPARRVLLDTHPYFVYSDQEKQTKDSGRLREVCKMEGMLQQSQKNYPTIAGEWAVNGPNGDRASDRDLPRAPVSFPDGPAYPYSKKYMAFMARNYAVQTATFEKAGGWIFWAVSGRYRLRCAGGRHSLC